MKNRILVVFLFAVAVVSLAVGCQKKEENNNNNNNNNQQQEVKEKVLTCSVTTKEDKYTQTNTYTLSFKSESESFYKASVQGQMKYNSGKFDEATYKKLSEQCKKDLEDTKKAGFTCNAQSSGSSIWLTYQFTMADLNDASKKLAKESALDEVNGKKLDEVKSAYEGAGFSCSVKEK